MFYKTVNKNNNKEMFNFLKNHFKYYTLNSWNGLQSIANNVKIYNLNIDYKILDILIDDEYFSINETIKDWEADHPGYSVGFNGRSGGYLVLYNKNNCKSILDYYIDINLNSDYDSFKQDIKENYKYIKEYHSILKEQTELVQDFDKLCDDLLELCKHMLKNYNNIDKSEGE